MSPSADPGHSRAQAEPGGLGGRPALLIADVEADGELLPALRDQGVDVAVVADGALALIEIGRLAPSAVLVTANLPVVDGVTVIRTVRSAAGRTSTPILFAVGPDDREQAAAALDAGATACLGKPYRVHEVLAMVGAVGGLATAGYADQPLPAATARPSTSPDGHPDEWAAAARVVVTDSTLARVNGHGAAAEPAGVTGVAKLAVDSAQPGTAALGGGRSRILRSGPIVLDVDAHEVTVDGRAVHMPPREFRLLRLLLGHAGRVVTRETLLTEVWGSPDTDPNTLAVHVRRLRRRLGDPAVLHGATTRETGLPGSHPPGRYRSISEVRPPLIESIRGIGYRFRAPHPS